jgi:hypothetical protein
MNRKPEPLDSVRRWWLEALVPFEDDSALPAIAQIGLVACGFRPVASGFRTFGWDALPDEWADRCSDGELIVGRDGLQGSWLVARDRVVYERVARVAASVDRRYTWLRGGGMDTPACRLGVVLGFPPSAIEAYAGLRRSALDDEARMPDLGPWASVLIPFVPAADKEGITEARAWVSAARAALLAALPGLPTPSCPG